MLKSENLSSEIAISLLFVLMWHAIIFIFCKTLSNDFFNYDKYIYKQKYWEDNGFFYSKRLKIKVWKDLLPQYISRNGFSKKSLDSLSIEYLDMFILETCRGEWAHRGCMLIPLLLLSLNRSVVGLVLGALIKVRPIVKLESIIAGLRKALPERLHHLLPLNQEALELGMTLID